MAIFLISLLLFSLSGGLEDYIFNVFTYNTTRGFTDWFNLDYGLFEVVKFLPINWHFWLLSMFGIVIWLKSSKSDGEITTQQSILFLSTVILVGLIIGIRFADSPEYMWFTPLLAIYAGISLGKILDRILASLEVRLGARKTRVFILISVLTIALLIASTIWFLVFFHNQVFKNTLTSHRESLRTQMEAYHFLETRLGGDDVVFDPATLAFFRYHVYNNRRAAFMRRDFYNKRYTTKTPKEELKSIPQLLRKYRVKVIVDAKVRSMFDSDELKPALDFINSNYLPNGLTLDTCGDGAQLLVAGVKINGTSVTGTHKFELIAPGIYEVTIIPKSSKISIDGTPLSDKSLIALSEGVHVLKKSDEFEVVSIIYTNKIDTLV